MVFTVLQFRFVYALTLVHVLTTLLGMQIFAVLGLYERKPLPVRPLLSLAAAFVGYIVCWNVSLQASHSIRYIEMKGLAWIVMSVRSGGASLSYSHLLPH